MNWVGRNQEHTAVAKIEVLKEKGEKEREHKCLVL
jgi:hypothetical protein